jgi:hypothetical protein
MAYRPTARVGILDRGFPPAFVWNLMPVIDERRPHAMPDQANK